MAHRANAQYQPGEAVSNQALTSAAVPLRPTPEPTYNPGRDPLAPASMSGLDPDEATVHQQLHDLYRAHIGAQPRGIGAPRRGQIQTAMKAADLGCRECASYTAGVRQGLAEAARRARGAAASVGQAAPATPASASEPTSPNSAIIQTGRAVAGQSVRGLQMSEITRTEAAQAAPREPELNGLANRVARDLELQRRQGGVAVEIALEATERGLRELERRAQAR